MSFEKRTYETICITKVDMPDDKFNALLERCKAAVEKEGKGQWLMQDDWGRAKIAYTIGKDNRGRWTYFRYKAEAPGVDEIGRALAINEFVLRHTTVRTKEDGTDYDTLRAGMPQDILDREKSRDAWREERSARFGGPRRGRDDYEQRRPDHALPGSDMSDDSEGGDMGDVGQEN
jgi:small subunit ribosomal protein S6